jgi:hypothetical protein
MRASEESIAARSAVVSAGGTITSTAADRISYLHDGPPLPDGIQGVLKPLHPELGGVASAGDRRTRNDGRPGASALRPASFGNDRDGADVGVRAGQGLSVSTR